MNRRKFIQTCSTYIPVTWLSLSFGLLTACTKNKPKSALYPDIPEGKTLVDDSSEGARQLHFTYDHLKVNKAVVTGKDASDMCGTCAYYTPYKDGEYGECSRLSGYVPHTGWCKGYRRKDTEKL